MLDGCDLVAAAGRGQSTRRHDDGKHGGDDWPAYAMREGPWMLVLDENRERAELHNVVEDREQANNVAAQQPQRVARMRDAIETWFNTLPNTVNPAMQTPAPKAAAVPGPADDAHLAANRALAFQRWDTNRDSVLTLSEYREGLTNKVKAEQRFANFDSNGDAQLTRDEFVGQR